MLVVVFYYKFQVTFVAEPEINNFDLQIFVQKNVFGFDVSMSNSHFMEIGYSLKDSFEHYFCLSFF